MYIIILKYSVKVCLRTHDLGPIHPPPGSSQAWAWGQTKYSPPNEINPISPFGPWAYVFC